jgi:hypothetical protein
MIVGGEWVKATMDHDLFSGPDKGIMPDADKLAPSLWVVQEGVQIEDYLNPLPPPTRRVSSTIRSASRTRRSPSCIP